MVQIFRLAAVCCFLGLVVSAPLSKDHFKYVTEERLDRLKTFGYLPNKTGSVLSPSTLQKALSDLQAFAGINVTGRFDYETIKMLEADRCGMKDPYPNKSLGKLSVGEYMLQGSVWDKAKRGQPLTFKVISFTRDIQSRSQQRRIFKEAFDKWQAVSRLVINDVTDNNPSVPDDQVDILISFGSRYHGDAYSFDGQGGTLAHAFYPHNNRGLSGDAHFDDDEYFTTGTSSGINLDWVALHEFGHSLGLEHSNVRESVMYPWYKGYKEDVQLTDDDIKGIQALYGRPVQPQTPPPSTGPPNAFPRECSLTSYDTFFNGADGKTYAAAGAYYWTIRKPSAGKESGPHPLTSKFPGLRTPVDAAFTKNGKTFFFKGSRYWEYRYVSNRFYATVTNQPISRYGLPSALNNMDAAFVYRNNRVYFFKGNQYYKYDEAQRRTASGYPRNISKGWRGLSGPVDSAMTWSSNKASYFFTGQTYVKIESSQHKVIASYLTRPRTIISNWMKTKCPSGVGAIVGALSGP